MKVGIVLDQYYKHDGGAFTFQDEVVSAVSRNLLSAKHEFLVFSPATTAVSGLRTVIYKKPSLIERLFLVAFRYWPDLQDLLGWRSGLERLLRSHGVEFVWFLSPRSKGTSLPFMTIVLDLQHRLQPQFPEVSASGEWQKRERHNRRWFPRASVILTGTRAGRDEITRFYGIDEQRIRILPHPTPASVLNADCNSSLKGDGLEPGFLFYPAQFWTHKNHLNLLKAIAQLRDEGLVLRAVFTGADYGAERTVREEITKLNLTDQVRMLGFVDHDQLVALYRNALALTYVSFFGPENLPPLEAFALNCPVIAANVSGAQEQLGDAAILVDPAEPAEIAADIRRVSEDPQLRERLRAAGKKRAASWTSDDFVRGVFDILDSFDRSRDNQ